MRLTIVAVAALAVTLGACERGPMEKAGEKTDSAVEEATTGHKDLTDGPAENLGEDLDKAGRKIEQGAQDLSNTVDKKVDEAKDKSDK